MLRGRRAECLELDRLLEAMHAGQSAVLVLRGEAGIGKTALLEYTAGRAEGCRVLHAVGVESEMELPVRRVQQLCAPMLAGLERLPAPQRDALGDGVWPEVGRPAGPLPRRAGRARACWRRCRGSSRFSARSMMRSGSIESPRRRSRSWRAACRRSRSSSCSRCVGRVSSTSWPGCRSCGSKGSRDAHAARCSRR